MEIGWDEARMDRTDKQGRVWTYVVARRNRRRMGAGGARGKSRDSQEGARA